MTKINYKSDFDFLLDLTGSGGNKLGFPEYDFELRIYVVTNPKKKFIASKVGNKLTHCFNDEDRIHITCDDHGLGKGTLYAEFYLNIPNVVYADGYLLTVTPFPLNIQLVRDTSDKVTDISITNTVPMVFINAYLLAVKYGYTGTEGDYMRAINRIPTLVDEIDEKKEELNTTLFNDYVTKTSFTSSLATKQNVIRDLNEIRTGAKLGATALQEVPTEYATNDSVDTKDTTVLAKAKNYAESVVEDLATKVAGVLHLGTFSTVEDGFIAAAEHAFDAGIGVLTFEVDWPKRNNAFTVTILQQQQHDTDSNPKSVQTLIGSDRTTLTYLRIIYGAVESDETISVIDNNVSWTKVNWFTAMQWDEERGLVCNSLSGDEDSQVVLMSEVAEELATLSGLPDLVQTAVATATSASANASEANTLAETVQSNTLGILHLGTFANPDAAWAAATNQAFNKNVSILTYNVDWAAREHVFVGCIFLQRINNGAEYFCRQILVGSGSLEKYGIGGATLYRIITPSNVTAWTEVKSSSDGGYQIPEGGIPKEDLSSEVRDSLKKANTAIQSLDGYAKSADLNKHVNTYTIHVTGAEKLAWNAKYSKPAEGIPYSDLSDDVKGSLDNALQKNDVVNSTGDSTDKVMSQKAITDALNTKQNNIALATVATTGDYNDLTNKPTIPDISNVIEADISSLEDGALLMWDADNQMAIPKNIQVVQMEVTYDDEDETTETFNVLVERSVTSGS